MRKDDPYKKASELFEEFEDIEATIGEHTILKDADPTSKEEYGLYENPLKKLQ